MSSGCFAALDHGAPSPRVNPNPLMEGVRLVS